MWPYILRDSVLSGEVKVEFTVYVHCFSRVLQFVSYDGALFSPSSFESWGPILTFFPVSLPLSSLSASGKIYPVQHRLKYPRAIFGMRFMALKHLIHSVDMVFLFWKINDAAFRAADVIT